MSPLRSIEINNDRTGPHIVWIEPWGEDCTMLPNDKLVVTVIATDTNKGPLFSLVETDGNTQLYIDIRNAPDFPQVLVNGDSVECGHNRQAAIEAGIWPG